MQSYLTDAVNGKKKKKSFVISDAPIIIVISGQFRENVKDFTMLIAQISNLFENPCEVSRQVLKHSFNF